MCEILVRCSFSAVLRILVSRKGISHVGPFWLGMSQGYLASSSLSMMSLVGTRLGTQSSPSPSVHVRQSLAGWVGGWVGESAGLGRRVRAAGWVGGWVECDCVGGGWGGGEGWVGEGCWRGGWVGWVGVGGGGYGVLAASVGSSSGGSVGVWWVWVGGAVGAG